MLPGVMGRRQLYTIGIEITAEKQTYRSFKRSGMSISSAKSDVNLIGDELIAGTSLSKCEYQIVTVNMM